MKVFMVKNAAIMFENPRSTLPDIFGVTVIFLTLVFRGCWRISE